MQANTKLTRNQKLTLKLLKAANPEIKLFSFPVAGLTVAVKRLNSSMVRVSTAVMSPDEMKFRRKVGESIAMDRMLDNQAITLQSDRDLEDIAIDVQLI